MCIQDILYQVNFYFLMNFLKSPGIYHLSAVISGYVTLINSVTRSNYFIVLISKDGIKMR